MAFFAPARCHGLEAYSRTSRESNLPTEPRGHLWSYRMANNSTKKQQTQTAKSETQIPQHFAIQQRKKVKSERGRVNKKEPPRFAMDFFSVQRLHGFRQVVQHVSKHVALEINWLIKSRKGRCCSGRKSKLVENRYIVLYTVTFIRKQAKKHRETTQQNTKTKNQHTQKQTPTQTTKQWRDSTSYGWKRSIEARGDSLVSSRRMQMTTCVPYWRRQPRFAMDTVVKSYCVATHKKMH